MPFFEPRQLPTSLSSTSVSSNAKESMDDGLSACTSLVMDPANRHQRSSHRLPPPPPLPRRRRRHCCFINLTQRLKGGRVPNGDHARTQPRPQRAVLCVATEKITPGRRMPVPDEGPRLSRGGQMRGSRLRLHRCLPLRYEKALMESYLR